MLVVSVAALELEVEAEEPAEALGRASELGADEAKVSGWVPF